MESIPENPTKRVVIVLVELICSFVRSLNRNVHQNSCFGLLSSFSSELHSNSYRGTDMEVFCHGILAILDLEELPCPARFCAKSCRGIRVPLVLVVLPWSAQKRRVLLPSESNSISAELCLFSCRTGTRFHCFSAAVQRACRAYFLDVCKFQAIATAFLHTSVRSLPTRD